jgi:maleylacetate reductase
MSQPQPNISFAGLPALRELLRGAAQRRILVIRGSDRHAARLDAVLDGFAVQVHAEARRHVPEELVEPAQRAFDGFGADTVLSVGGGSATGLAKALRATRDFFFVAVPTTYAGSELTDLYGITSALGKQTRRDPRVIPDAVFYDVELTLDMPLVLSVTSLMNSLAHPLSALSTGELDVAASDRALRAADAVYRAIRGLLGDPTSRVERLAAFKANVLAGQVLATSRLGVHHRLAHLLGGHFDLDHAGLHSVLLPHSMAHLRATVPALYTPICAQLTLAEAEFPRELTRLLEQAGAKTSLAALGVPRAEFLALIAEHPELPRQVLDAAF